MKAEDFNLVTTDIEAWEEYVDVWLTKLRVDDQVLRVKYGFSSPEIFTVTRVTEQRVYVSDGFRYHKATGRLVLGIVGSSNSLSLLPLDSNLAAIEQRAYLIDCLDRLNQWHKLELPELEQVWSIVKDTKGNHHRKY